MKKVLFLMILLFLIVLGTANIKAQVRIGGDTVPNAAAVLDLNVNNDATPAANKGALALPRVSLGSTTATLNGATPINGMLVYNTNASMTGGSGIGEYLWNQGKWERLQIYRPDISLSALRLYLDTTLIAGLLTPGTRYIFSLPGLYPTESLCMPVNLFTVHVGISSAGEIALFTYYFADYSGAAIHVKCYSWVTM